MEAKYRLIDLLDDISEGKNIFFQLVRLVEDVMVKEVKTLSPDDTIEKCIKFMKENRVRHIPIIDNTSPDQPKYLVGVVSQRDIFRQISVYLGKIGEKDTDLQALKQPLIQILTRNPKSVSPQTSIPDAIKIMINNHVDMLPVLDGSDIVGIITSTDLLKIFFRLNIVRLLCQKSQKKEHRRYFIDLLSGNSNKPMLGFSSILKTVEDIMTEDVVCLERQDKLSDAMQAMQSGKFRHIPVVTKQNKLEGVVSDRDVLLNLPFHRGQLNRDLGSFRKSLFDVNLSDSTIHQNLDNVMNSSVIHIHPSCDFHTAVRMLYEKTISCIPVTDDEERVVGIVTLTDVIRGLLAMYALFEKSCV